MNLIEFSLRYASRFGAGLALAMAGFLRLGQTGFEPHWTCTEIGGE